MIKREIENVCIDLFKQYPVITITGPRQSGKTTLTRALFPDKPYFNLEQPDIRRSIADDPRGFLEKHSDGAILDEIQRVPVLPSFIQGAVDENPKNGLYVLTGSQQFEISQSISQSLAGRTATIKLLPLTLSELSGYSKLEDVDQVMVNGFYPRLHIQQIPPYHFFNNYFETYIERDIRHLSQIDNLMLFDKFIRLTAARAGSILNFSSLSNDCGVSPPTIHKWVSLLEASYVLFLLPPYFRNVGKRLIKTPKVYFYDTGLLCFLLGIENTAHLTSHPLRGNVFENLVIAELLKKRFNQARRSNLFFFRDRSGNEVDVIMENNGKLVPVEIKSSSTRSPDFLKTLRMIKQLFPSETENSTVVYNGDSGAYQRGYTFVNWKETGTLSE